MGAVLCRNFEKMRFSRSKKARIGHIHAKIVRKRHEMARFQADAWPTRDSSEQFGSGKHITKLEPNIFRGVVGVVQL